MLFIRSKHRKRESGFSLIEVVIGVGILIVIALGIGSVVNGLMKVQSVVSDRDEANEFAAALGRYLYNDSTCSTSLAGVTFPVGGATEITLTGYNGYGASTGTINLQGASTGAPTMIGPRLRVKSIVLRDKQLPPQNVISGGATFVRYVAQIELNLERNSEGAWAGVPPRYFEFPVLLNGGAIQSCQLELRMDDACTLLGSTLTVNGAGQQVCQPQTQCQVQGAYAQATCSPAYTGCSPGTPNPLTGSHSCPPNAVASQTGHMSQTFNVSCGKKCSYDVTQTIEFFVCMRCN